jgi:hypothetical protein
MSEGNFMLRHAIFVAAAMATSGCMLKSKEVAKVAPEPPPVQAQADCYTVVLFDKHPIKKPEDGVTPEQARYLGHWKQGAWNNVWCHDLLVTEVKKGGEVRIVDMHAPYEPWGQPATAFQRIGQIDKDGHLRVRYGNESVVYRFDNGRLIAERSGNLGNLVAVLQLDGYVPPVPLPPVRPNGLASGPQAAPQTASKAIATF